MVSITPEMRARWAITAETRQRFESARAADLERVKGAQLEFDFSCPQCAGELDHDCPGCHGDGCDDCEHTGRVDCACEAGPPDLPDA